MPPTPQMQAGISPRHRGREDEAIEVHAATRSRRQSESRRHDGVVTGSPACCVNESQAAYQGARAPNIEMCNQARSALGDPVTPHANIVVTRSDVQLSSCVPRARQGHCRCEEYGATGTVLSWLCNTFATIA